MFQEKRPTCVTVIGWVWIILGGFMFLGSIMALFSFVMIGEMSQAHPDAQDQIPTIFSFFPLIAAIQIILSILGFVSAIYFLKLRSWSRSILEILTWIMLLVIVGFGIFWEFGWLSMSSGIAPRGFDIMGAVIGFFIILIYAVPLGIMLKYLRGNKVKNAITSTGKPPSPSDA